MAKAYIGNEDWADEGDVFFFSIESEENLMSMLLIINFFIDHGIFDNTEEIEIYWGTNEFFQFTLNDFIDFIRNSEHITDSELKVFDKFKVTGFDIYKQIKEELNNIFYDYFVDIYRDDLTQDDKLEIRSYFIDLFGQKEWDNLYNNRIQWIN